MSKYFTSRKIFIAAAITSFFVANAFCENSQVSITYPTPYASYRNVQIERNFTIGKNPATPATDWFQIANPAAVTPVTSIHGDLLIRKTAANTGGNLTIRNCLFRAGGPDYSNSQTGSGPYGWDGFRVAGNSFGNVFIGGDPAKISARFKAETVTAGKRFFAVQNPPSSGTNRLYGEMRGFTDLSQPSIPDTRLQKKAQFRAKYDNGTDGNFTDDYFGPMRIDGYYLRFGEKNADRVIYDAQGHMDTVLIGAQNVAAGFTPANVFLQVGNPGDGSSASGDFRAFSSREFKKDITPLTTSQYREALSMISQTPLWYYRFKGDAADSKMRLGLITEDTPRELIMPEGKAINLYDTLGHLAAAMKQLKSENDALKKRLEILEKKRSTLQNTAK